MFCPSQACYRDGHSSSEPGKLTQSRGSRGRLSLAGGSSESDVPGQPGPAGLHWQSQCGFFGHGCRSSLAAGPEASGPPRLARFKSLSPSGTEFFKLPVAADSESDVPGGFKLPELTFTQPLFASGRRPDRHGHGDRRRELASHSGCQPDSVSATVPLSH